MLIGSSSGAARPLAALAFGALLAWSPGARAFVSEGGTLYSGLFGLAPGQVAQLNVAHVSNPEISCGFEVVAFDAGGRRVRRATATVAPGRSVRLELPYAELAATPVDDRASGRKRLRLEIKGFNPQPDPPGCLATLEVYDGASGATRVGIGSPGNIPAPR